MDQAQWQKIADWPLTLAAVVFLVAYSFEVIGDLDGPRASLAEGVIWVTWAVFLADYILNLVLARPRWLWFRTHIFDLLVVVLPMLRPLRLLRLLTLLNVLHRSAGAAFRSRVIVYVAGAASLLVFLSALAVLDSERAASDATIASFPDAIWWAFVTISTVGYGDLSPVTDLGRVIAVGLMLGGVALLGVVTATLASWIVERVAKQEEDAQAATRGEIKALSQQIADLHDALDGSRVVEDVRDVPAGRR